MYLINTLLQLSTAQQQVNNIYNIHSKKATLENEPRHSIEITEILKVAFEDETVIEILQCSI